MIDIQNHLRNRGLLNLFDGQSVAPEERHISGGCGSGKTENYVYLTDWTPVERLWPVRPAWVNGVLKIEGAR